MPVTCRTDFDVRNYGYRITPGCHKTLCATLSSKGSYTISSFFSLSTLTKISTLAPRQVSTILKLCASNKHFDQYNRNIYIHCSVPQKNSGKLLSSNAPQLLLIPRFKTNIASRSFSVAAHTVWNTLPDNVSQQIL